MEIERKIDKSLKKVTSLKSHQSFEFIKDSHHLNQREFRISKGDKCLTFETTSKVISGVQTHKELDFNRGDEYELKNDEGSLFVKGKDILINNISYSEDHLKILTGSIYSVSDKSIKNKKQNLFRRFILPLNSDSSGLTDFQKYKLVLSEKRSWGFFLPVSINGSNYYLYETKHEGSNYVLIDSSIVLPENDFQKICFNILLALAFVKGNLYHDECYLLGFENESMEDVVELSYYSMRVSLKTNQPTFTTNMFSIYGDEFEGVKGEDEEQQWRKRHYSDVYDFSAEIFSRLSELFQNEEKAQRAAILFIHGHQAALEIRLPNYYVALEAITSLISSDFKDAKERLNPIKDNNVADEIISRTLESLDHYIKEKGLGPKDIDVEIIKRKLSGLNTPPNADKLSEPFTRLGFNLSEEQVKILKQRNSYLHGSFVKFVDDDKAFEEALYISLRVHFLIAVLVLKKVGFTGKIINYSSLWESMTNRTLNEERMVKI